MAACGLPRITRLLKRARLLERAGLLVGASLLAAGGATPASAEVTYYNVEIIVFEERGTGGFAAENWRSSNGGPATGSAIDLRSGSANGYQSLDPKGRNLQGAFDKLQAARTYRPVIHRAWRQRGSGKQEARWVRLKGGSVDGVVRIYVRRYLHIDADLMHFRDGGRYRMKSTRRMRSRELHYMDHPLFGLLVRVTPLDDSATAPSDSQTVTIAVAVPSSEHESP